MLRQDIYRSRKRSMPSLYSIAVYWLEPDSQMEARASGEASGFVALVVDPGEPSCVRCGWRIPQLSQRLNGDGSTDLRREWKAAGAFIDRAHLANHAEDGPDTASNLVPLCHLCHRDMPWFNTRREALAWVAAGCDRPWIGYIDWTRFTDHVYGEPYTGKRKQIADELGFACPWGWRWPSDGRKELRDLYAHFCERVAIAMQTERPAA